MSEQQKPKPKLTLEQQVAIIKRILTPQQLRKRTVKFKKD